jgi:hypothetical protein
VIQELEQLAAREPPFLESDPIDRAVPFLEVLVRGAPISRVWTGPTFHFPEELPASPGTVRVSAENADLLSPYLEKWAEDTAGESPLLADLVDGRAVSVCCSVRIATRAEEAGVETHIDYRGRGHGARVVAAWVAALRSRERIPLYSTSWENRSSRQLANRLGLLQYGSTFHVT